MSEKNVRTFYLKRAHVLNRMCARFRLNVRNIRLRNFDKIELAPGETKTVTLKLKASDLAFVGYDGKWRLEKGDFTIKCGDQRIDISCTQTKIWDTPNR